MWRKCDPVVQGILIAMGLQDPGMDYFLATTNGEGEARLKKIPFDMRRRFKEN